MSRFYPEYEWKEGIPYGKYSDSPPIYKIVTDPYKKRFSVERYQGHQFLEVVYDSLLLDFRKLKQQEQQGWQKEVLKTSPSEIECIIRNQEDRVIFRENHFFEQHLCRECRVFSPHGLLLSVNKMHYTYLGDPWDGVVLYDANQHPVMCKKYQSNQNGDFTELVEEKWDAIPNVHKV